MARNKQFKSNMVHKFSEIPAVRLPRSKFDRGRTYKTTFNAGQLIPIFVDEALPGDTFNLNMTGFARLATPIHPIMDNLFLDSHWFSVPKRLLWDNWPKFNGEQTNPGDSTDFTIPTADAHAALGYTEGTIGDYLGIPTKVPSLTHNALPMRAIRLIWNQWFRDENLQDSLTISTGDGPDFYGNETPYPRGKRHDYFTSCLPWPQKGDSVDIPLGTSADIYTTSIDSQEISIGQGIPAGTQTFLDNAGAGLSVRNEPGTTLDPINLHADLSTASAATINQLRQASRIQALLEKDARGGTRYTEIIKAHFGVTSPDARLQRPEFLGGGTSHVNITPVPQTSETSATAQGTLAGYGTTIMNGHGFTHSFTEHCYVFGFISARADLTYQQGLNRLWNRRTRPDFYWPDLAHIGEQAVLNKEIFADGSANDELPFGYQERYAEYRYGQSLVTGLFRSNAAASLDPWHLSQEFGGLPVLDDTFIRETPPMARIEAVPTEPDFIFDSRINCIAARTMPVNGVPGIKRF